MNVTFLVTVNLDDLSSLADVANEINDDLSNAGFEVITVTPWARPSLKQAVRFTQAVPTTNTTTQNPNIQL